MTWREKAAAIVAKAPTSELTKPTKGAFVSNVSTPPAPFPQSGRTDPAVDDEDYGPADLVKMDDLLRQLAELEGWPVERLTACLDERRRMAPVNVMPTLRGLQAAVRDALAIWPNKPTWRANIQLCRLVH